VRPTSVRLYVLYTTTVLGERNLIFPTSLLARDPRSQSAEARSPVASANLVNVVRVSRLLTLQSEYEVVMALNSTPALDGS